MPLAGMTFFFFFFFSWQLLDQCLAPDTSGDGTGCDNMTCIIVRFKPFCPSKRKLEDGEMGSADCSDSNKKAKRD